MPSLLTRLLAHLKLDETAGPRADDRGVYSLADHNGTGATAGLLGNAADFTAASAQRLASSAAAFPSVVNGLSVHGWIYPNDEGMVFALDSVSGTDRLMQISWSAGSGGLLEAAFFGSGSLITLNSPGGSVPASTWSRIAVWWDPADGKGRIQINDDPVVASSGALAALNAAAVVPVEIGDLGGFSQPYGGLCDEFAMWNRVLTGPERTTLFNSGIPLDYSDYGPPISPIVTVSARPDYDQALGALPLGEFAFSYLVSAATAPTLCVRVTYRSSVQTVGYQSSVRTVAYGSSTVRAYYGDRP